jgi:threonine aldolase
LEEIKEDVILGTDVHLYVHSQARWIWFLKQSYSAPTQVIALENTLNGTIFPQDEIIAISNYAHSLGIKMHLDGARIWHVAAETGTSIKELCAPFDSVSVCFSKGLGEVHYHTAPGRNTHSDHIH